MTEVGVNHIAAWFGTVAALCTTISFVPQAIKIIRERQTRGISVAMYLLFTGGVLCWLIYGILIGSAPVYLSNGATLLLAGTILGMKLKLG